MINAKNRAKLAKIKARQRKRQNRIEVRNMFLAELKSLFKKRNEPQINKLLYEQKSNKSKWVFFAVGIVTAGVVFAVLKNKKR